MRHLHHDHSPLGQHCYFALNSCRNTLGSLRWKINVFRAVIDVAFENIRAAIRVAEH